MLTAPEKSPFHSRISSRRACICRLKLLSPIQHMKISSGPILALLNESLRRFHSGNNEFEESRPRGLVRDLQEFTRGPVQVPV